MRVAKVLLAAAAAIALLTACPKPDDGLKPSLNIVSVNTNGSSARAITAFTNPPTNSNGFIVSGAPDYLKVTLKSIVLNGTFEDGSNVHTVWSDAAGIELLLDGSTAVDTSAMILSFPAGTVTSIDVRLASAAKIKGSLAGVNLRDDPAASTFIADQTVRTVAALSWDSYARAGGSASYADFATAAAEEAAINLSSDQSETLISSTQAFTLAAGDSPALTILVDLSRALRFYDGMQAVGASGETPGNKAYFFCQSVFPQSVGVFFGTPGKIQGYQAQYAAYDTVNGGDTVATNTHVEGVTGWMTLVFDAAGNVLSGCLIGDDDNALTVGKGRVFATSPNPDLSFDLNYYLDQSYFTLFGFVPATALDEARYATFAAHENYDGTHHRFGEVRYTLKF
jgi:hypothetical protein